MQTRETIRSGRRENFYVTDNSFIDHYARELQPVDIAVYHALERYANCHTRSTWVGTAKIAEVLNVSQRTVQRSLKVLEDLKLIRIVQTSTVKMFFIVPVPPRAKVAATPLFDQVSEEELLLNDDTAVAWTTDASRVASSVSQVAPSASRKATGASPARDIRDGAYKEEQDFTNNTSEQNLFNNNPDNLTHQVVTAAKRIVDILGLNDSSMAAAMAAVEERRRQTQLSMDGIVQAIVTEANRAARTGTNRHEFLDDFLVDKAARRIVKDVHLPETNPNISAIAAAVKAEAAYTQSSVEEVVAVITGAALDDRRRGIAIDRFYFEGVKWRSHVRVNKAEQRKLNNLEVNARVKQRLREKLGAS